MRNAYILSGLVVTQLMLLAVSPAAAQVSGGVKAGVITSEFATDPEVTEGLSSLSDFGAGAFVVIDRRAPITAEIEALVTRRGASVGGSLFDFVPGGAFLGDLIKLKGTYLDTSVFARAQFGEANQFYVFAGPTVGLRLKAELTAIGLSQDLKDVTKDYDVAAAVGAGVDIQHLILEGRYTYGLTDLIEGVNVFNVHVRNRSFLLMAGVRF